MNIKHVVVNSLEGIIFVGRMNECHDFETQNGIDTYTSRGRRQIPYYTREFCTIDVFDKYETGTLKKEDVTYVWNKNRTQRIFSLK